MVTDLFPGPARPRLTLPPSAVIVVGAVAIGALASIAGPHLVLVTVAAVGAVVAGLRLDVWQRLYVVLLASLALATSVPEESAALWPQTRFAAAGLLLAYTFVKYRHRLAWPATRAHRLFILALGAFFLLSAASLVWTFDRGVTLRNLAAGVAIIGAPAVASLSRWRDEALLHADIRTVYWAIVVLAGAAVAQDAVSGGLTTRVSGFFNNPNTLGDLAALGFALGLGTLWEVRHRSILVVSQVFLVFVLLMTQARSGIAAAAIACAWVGLRASNTERVRIVLGTALLALVATGFFWMAGLRMPDPAGRAIERFRPAAGGQATYTFLSDREQMWRRAVELWEEAPLMGHGFRSAELLFRSQSEAYGLSIRNETAHSGVLQLLVESGAIGLAIVVVAFAAVLVGRAPEQGRARAAWFSTSAATVAGAAIQSVESSVMGFGGTFAIVLWTALAAAARVGLPMRRDAS